MGNIAFIMIGGSGTRMGGDRPKQYIEINGKPIFYYIAKKYAALTSMDYVCVVTNKRWHSYVVDSIADISEKSKIIIVDGGENRSESIWNGLQKMKAYAGTEDIVFIHDGTHPYLDETILDDLEAAVRECGGATVGMCQYDTCYWIDDEYMLERVIPREYMVSGASPEAFYYRDLYNIYVKASKEEKAEMTSAGAIAIAHHIRMKVVPTKVLNLKLTYPEDMELCKLLLNSYFFNDEG